MPGSAFAENENGEAAAAAANELIEKLDGFVATYKGKSLRTNEELVVVIGYEKPEKLVVRVPKMDFYATHAGRTIKIAFQKQGLMIPFEEIRQLSSEAFSGFAAISWLGVPDPAKGELVAQLSFDLGESTLDVGINFEKGPYAFSWLKMLRSPKAEISEEGNQWVTAVPLEDGRKYKYWISKKTGVLEKMLDEKDGEKVRELALTDLKKERPKKSEFDNVFPEGMTPERFSKSAAQKAQFLIGMYDGLQDQVLRSVLPKWTTLGIDERKTIANAVSVYWRMIFKNIFSNQKASLEKRLTSPDVIEQVKKRASDKFAYEKFVNSLPDEKAVESKELWIEKTLGQVGFELLDPFVGWTRDRFITRAKKKIETDPAGSTLEKAERNKLLAVLSLPIIDACYSTAEPIVLPKLMPVIKEAAAKLE